ncbi:MAG: GIY-YIG nuclease family protein [Rhodospirillales bacterium]|nr:GIY-YIG nuclease family protein [Rhodospirillales bacterium]
MNAYVYIVRCADSHYYVGTTRGSLEKRIAEHNAGTFGGYTKSRRPVSLVYHQDFERFEDAIAAECQLKGWSRAKKEALMRGDIEALKRLAKPGPQSKKASFDRRAKLAAQDEGNEK